jgi:hypothetical protein
MKPSLFYGIAASACLGLVIGLVMHSLVMPGLWEWRAGGPQILAPSAAAAALARGSDAIETAAPAQDTAYADNAYAQLPPAPLPVTRLTGPGGAALPAAAEVQRAPAETAQQDGEYVTTVGEFRNDDPAPVGPRRLVTAVGDGR